MVKESKINSNVISGFFGGQAPLGMTQTESSLSAAKDPHGFFTSVQNDRVGVSQRGRSMVEMLGVLAIVGVLSVGGVYGYGVASKKIKANNALHQASMLATTVSAYALSNDGNLPSSVADFGASGYAT